MCRNRCKSRKMLPLGLANTLFIVANLSSLITIFPLSKGTPPQIRLLFSALKDTIYTFWLAVCCGCVPETWRVESVPWIIKLVLNTEQMAINYNHIGRRRGVSRFLCGNWLQRPCVLVPAESVQQHLVDAAAISHGVCSHRRHTSMHSALSCYQQQDPEMHVIPRQNAACIFAPEHDWNSVRWRE